MVICMLLRHRDVSQWKFVIPALTIAGFSPVIASVVDRPLAVVFSVIICILIWAQEALIIQLKYRDDNVIFTRRFNEKYSGSVGIILGFVPMILSAIVVLFLLIEIDFNWNFDGLIIIICSFFTLIRIFDPLLGCISSHEPILVSSMITYIVIFSFAASSAMNPSNLDLYGPVPNLLLEFGLLALITYTILNLRMAYYLKYCFLQEQSLEMQLKLVLIPLLVLSINQVVSIVSTIDFTSILNR
jgi:hypothetical protein